MSTGSYTIYYVYNVNGCVDTVAETTFLSNASVNFGSDSSLCATASLLLSVNNGFANYQWSTGATTNSILVDSIGVGFGDTLISLQVTDSLNCNGVDTILITFVDCTSLNDMDGSEFIINLYPNPSTGLFTIESNKSSLDELDMQVLDMSSKILINRKIYSKSGRFIERIDLSAFAKGVYFVRLSNGKQWKQMEVIVQ